jgi:hypothetical protein
MRRGFARVLDHERIIDVLANGDWLYAEARRARAERRAESAIPASV